MDEVIFVLMAARKAKEKEKEKERAIVSQTMAECPLPPEILLMILEYYVAERYKELVALRSGLLDCETEDERKAFREKRGRKPEWPIWRILVTAKFFHVNTVPLLYSKVILLKGETLMDFCRCPALSSYYLIEELYVDADVEQQDYYAGDINDITYLRHLAMLCKTATESDLFCNSKNLDDMEQFRDLFTLWREELLPSIGVMSIRNCRMRNLVDLSKLFRTEHLVIDGYYGEREPAVAINMYPKVTLICDPTEEYNSREGGHTTQSAPVDSQFPRFNLHCQLELALGGKSSRPGGPKSYGYPISAAKTIISLLRSFPNLGEFECESERITISPYLGLLGDDHTWCFAGPIAPVKTGWREPDFVFESNCDCGNGSKTHFWDGARGALLRYSKPLLEKDRDGDLAAAAEHAAKVLAEEYGT